MKSALPPSKSASELDNSIGFITVHELHNAYVEFMRRLDREVWPVGKSAKRDEIIQFLESWRLRLLTRAEAREPKKPAAKSPPVTQLADSQDPDRSRYEQRRDRLAKFHDTK